MKYSLLLFFLYFVKSKALVRPDPVTFAFEKQFGSDPYFLQTKCDLKEAIAVTSAARELYKENLKVDKIIKDKLTKETTSNELKNLTEKYCDENEKFTPLSQKLVDAAQDCLKNYLDDIKKQEILETFVRTICETTFAEFNWDIVWKEKFDKIHTFAKGNQIQRLSKLNFNTRESKAF